MNNKEVNIKQESFRLLLAILVILTIVSCGQTNNNKNQSISYDESPILTVEPNNTVDDENPISETSETTNIPSSEENNETNTLVKLNPPHGEPGHSCSIPVGAPLDSQPINNIPTPTTSITSMPVTPTVNTPPNKRVGPTIENLKNFKPSPPINSTLTLNPPHGQPGHRCDIAVGDPLPSASLSNIKINPPHGQPGHRCDIAVGDPLPS